MPGPRGVQNKQGTVAHANGTATATAATVTFDARTTALMVTNRDTTNDLLVSFDGGTTFTTIVHNSAGDASLSVTCTVDSLQIKSSTGSVSYEILYTKIGATE